jgi:phenylacetate-CoA ligase
VRVIPIAIGQAIHQTPGLRRFQIVQTGKSRLTLRLAMEPGADGPRVWEEVTARLRALLAARSVTQIEIERSPDPPGVDARNGKFRRIWSELQAPPRLSRLPGRD